MENTDQRKNFKWSLSPDYYDDIPDDSDVNVSVHNSFLEDPWNASVIRPKGLSHELKMKMYKARMQCCCIL